MDATLIIPADLVPHLRRGLFGEWGAAAEKLSNLAHQFGAGARDGVYMTPYHAFYTIGMLLGEVGWKAPPTERAVRVNLGVGTPYIIKSLEEEHHNLVQRLKEMPKTVSNNARRDDVSKSVSAITEFISSIEIQAAARARRGQLKPEPIDPTAPAPLSATAPCARRAPH